jgi:hypothetical protein
MATKTKNPTTLDDLAVIINGGFIAIQKQIDKVKGTMKDMAEELNATHEDVHYIRSQHGMGRCPQSTVSLPA